MVDFLIFIFIYSFIKKTLLLYELSFECLSIWIIYSHILHKHEVQEPAFSIWVFKIFNYTKCQYFSVTLIKYSCFSPFCTIDKPSKEGSISAGAVVGIVIAILVIGGGVAVAIVVSWHWCTHQDIPAWTQFRAIIGPSKTPFKGRFAGGPMVGQWWPAFRCLLG